MLKWNLEFSTRTLNLQSAIIFPQLLSVNLIPKLINDAVSIAKSI